MWLKWWTLKHMAQVIQVPVINRCHYNSCESTVVPVHVMMACRRHRGTAPFTLDLALDGHKWSVSCLRYFMPWGRSPTT
jgi:hypothetical protein